MATLVLTTVSSVLNGPVGAAIGAVIGQAIDQRAFRDGPTARADSRALAAAISADEAKGFAEARLSWLWAARSTAKLRLDWRRLGLTPGSVVTLEKEPPR
jgi:hypothetical protein